MDVEREIIERLRHLRPEQQRLVLNFVTQLAESGQPRRDVCDYALTNWLSLEEDTAREHLQQDSESSEGARQPTSGRLRGLSGEEMLRFAGVIPVEELDEMERVIEEECETIDPDEW